MSSQQFNVGDVVCKEEAHKGEMCQWKGVVVRLTSDPRRKLFKAEVKWVMPTHFLGWEHVKDLTHWEADPKFMAGDKVMAGHNGEVGTIVKVDPITSPEYKVRWENSPGLADSWEFEEDLEKLQFSKKGVYTNKKKGKGVTEEDVEEEEADEEEEEADEEECETSEMSQELMDQLQTVSLKEIVGVLVHSHHLHLILGHIANYLEEDHEDRRVGGE